MELVKGKKYEARLAFERQELAKARKIAKENENQRKAVDEEVQAEEEVKAKMRYRLEKKAKLARREKLVDEMLQRQIDHERAREIEKEILELERLELEERRRLEEEEMLEQMKMSKKKDKKGGKGKKEPKNKEKGAKKGKKDDNSGKSSKGDKTKDKKKGKGDKKASKGSQKSDKRVVLIPDPILDEAVLKEHAFLVDREEIYEDSYWNNIDYFDWEVISLLSSSDDDDNYETCYQKRYPLTEQSRLRQDFTSKLDSNWKSHEVKQTLKAKLKSLNDIQKSTVVSKKTYFCHKEERDKREERRQRKVEKMLEDKYNIDIGCLPKNSKVVNRIKQYKAEQEAREKGKIERRIEIIQKLLNEEKRKHPRKIERKVEQIRKKSEEVEQVEVDIEGGGDWLDVDEAEPEPEVAEILEEVVEEPVVIEQVEKKSKKGKKGEKKPKEKKKKDKKGKSDKSKKKKGKSVSEDEYVPPPPPLKRERIGPENVVNELLKDFEQIKLLEEVYAKDKTHIQTLPTERAFVWKPEIIVFKNFQPDKVYHKTIHVNNLRSNVNIYARFKEVTYPKDLFDPLLLNVKCQEYKKICPGLGFTIELTFRPDNDTKSFEANLVFLSKRGVNEPLSQFTIPVSCDCEEPDTIEIVPDTLTFPTVPCWSRGRFGVHLCRIVKLVNNTSREFTVSMLNVDEYAGFLALDNGSDPFADIDCENIEEVERVLDRYDYTEDDANPTIWPKTSLDSRLLARDSRLFPKDSQSFRGDSKMIALDSRLNVKRSEKGLTDTMSRWELLYPQWSLHSELGQCTCCDLLEECFDNVFLTFRFEDKYHITVPPRSTTKVKLHFNAFEAGKFEEKITVLVTDDKNTSYETHFRAFAETTPLPIRVSPAALNFRVCLQDSGLYQDVIKVFNDGNLPCAVQPTIPPSLRKFFFVRPSQCHVQPFSYSNFAIKFAPSWKMPYVAPKYFRQSEIEFPIRIVIKGTAYGQCPSLQVPCKALVTSAYSLVLRPPTLELGRVSTNETVSAEIQLTNNSLVSHEFAFLNLPEFVMLQPNYGFGTVSAGQTVKLDLLYSPGPKNIAGNAIGKGGLEGLHAFKIAVTTKACLAGSYKGDKNKIARQIVEEQRLFGKPETADDEPEEDKEHRDEESLEVYCSIKSDIYSGIISEDELWSEILEEPEAKDPIAEQEEELLKHLEEIFADDDEIDMSGDVTGSRDKDDTDRDRSVGSEIKSWFSGSAMEPSISSLKNLVRFSEADTSTIRARWANAIDSRLLKTEIGVLAQVYDPLCGLSSSRIEFPSTPCGSYSILSFTFDSVNKATATECYCGLLKKIDKRTFSATFEFKSPTSELVFVPAKGTIKSGEKLKVYIVFRPALPQHEVEARARELKAQRMAAEKRKAYLDELENSKKGKKGKGSKKGKEKKTKEKKGKKGKGSGKESESSVPEFEVDPSSVVLEHVDNFPAEKSLFHVLEPSCTSHVVSCMVDIASPCPEIAGRRDHLKLIVVCPVERPDFVIKPDVQRVQFGPVAIGTRPKTTFGVLNIGSRCIRVQISPVNPVGAFAFPSPHIPCLDPEHTAVVPVTFAPDRPGLTEEYVELRSGRTVVSVVIAGTGVTPVFSLSPEFALYRFDGPSGKKKGDCKVVIENTCEAPLSFNIEQVFLRDAVDKPPEKPVNTEPAVKGKKEKKEKKSKKKIEKMCAEISPEDELSLSEEFKDVDKSVIGVFEFVGLEPGGDILVPPNEKREFKVKFVLPKAGGPAAGEKGSKKGKGKNKGDDAKSKSGKSEKSSKSSKSSKSGNTKSGTTGTATTDKSGVEGSKGYPQKYAGKFKVTLGKLVDVKEIVFMGFQKKGKEKKGKK